MRHLLVLGVAILCGCGGQAAPTTTTSQPTAATRPANLAATELAMVPGQTIRATTPVGTIEIHADDWLKRSYTWEGATRSVEMWPRAERWYGSFGVYYPGPGRHWEEHRGITRGVVEEGQQHFDSVEAAVDWIAKPERQWTPHAYRNDGLLVGWSKTPEREQLNVVVWQIVVNGKRPTKLPGATDLAIQVSLP